MTQTTDKPTFVRIMSHTYEIEWRDCDATHLNRIGECDSLAHTIMVCDRMPDSRKAEVLLHEMFHAYHFNWKPGMAGSDETKEEELTEFSGQCMALMMAQNSDVILWCMNQLR